jgi:hypothetical protein
MCLGVPCKTAFQSAELLCHHNSSIHEALVIDKLVSYLMHATLCVTLDMLVLFCLHVCFLLSGLGQKLV